MHQIDDSDWPILIISLMNSITLPDTQAFLGAFDDALARRQPFGVIMVSDQTDNKNTDKQAVELRSKWLKENRPRVGQYCRGLAVVTPHTSLLVVWQTMIRLTGPHLFGCPGSLFLTIDEARDWVKEKLQ